MNDLFRAIFGIPSNNRYGVRMDDRIPQGYRKGFSGNSGDDDDDDDDNDEDHNANMSGGIFGFPLFNDPTEIHRQFNRLVNEMNKAFGVFGYRSNPSITWEGGSYNDPSIFAADEEPKEQSLRDAYLKKTDCSCNKINQKDDFNLGVNIKIDDFQPGTSNNINSVQYSYPKVYSKSVFIQTVKRPDGSVETIKTVRDHEGNEETTISQSNVNDPLPPQHPEQPQEDVSGISIFKKFFSF